MQSLASHDTARPTTVPEPISADEWNGSLDTDRGAEISDLLAPFHAEPPALAPPVPHLELETAAGLALLGEKPCRIAIVRLGALRDEFARLPAYMTASARTGFLTGVHQATLTGMSGILRKAFRGDCDPDFVGATDIGDRLFSRLHRRLDESSGGLVTPFMKAGFDAVLAYHVMLLAVGRPDLAARAGQFTALCRCGNVPVGIMRDGTFLVVTA